ncbi:MAG TPA: AhpC/TSA family protein [Solirubrobacteraceae bacterium]|nr:AhpC/TSA family protein [Solirubrobacteraceae bacterium]
MDPRTFLRPPALPTADAPAEGERSRELPLAPAPGRATIVAFLRHTGCPFAERTMQMLREGAARRSDVGWVAISHATAADTERWCAAIGGTGGVRVASDASRRAYAAWGLGRTSLAHFLGRRSLGAVAELARAGIRNRHPDGTRWQSAGTFAIDREGIVRWRSLPAHAGELPDLDAALSALDGAGDAGASAGPSRA